MELQGLTSDSLEFYWECFGLFCFGGIQRLDLSCSRSLENHSNMLAWASRVGKRHKKAETLNKLGPNPRPPVPYPCFPSNHYNATKCAPTFKFATCIYLCLWRTGIIIVIFLVNTDATMICYFVSIVLFLLQLLLCSSCRQNIFHFVWFVLYALFGYHCFTFFWRVWFSVFVRAGVFSY